MMPYYSREQYPREPKTQENNIGNVILSSISYALLFGGVYVVTSITTKYLKELLNSKYQDSMEIARKLRRPELAKLNLDSYEARIGKDSVVAVDELVTTFHDIGGMKEELEDVVDNIVLPLQIWRSMKTQHGVLPCPTGVLLYGAPGTGKTLTARALAKECSATFLHISSSSLLDKWLGESDKLVAGLFTLARKLAPTIIFIDEIDSILRSRASADHQPAMATIQSVLLSEWDGLKSADMAAGPVILVGATNRPSDIDPAFLRRLPVLVKTKTPTIEGRADILKKMLIHEHVSDEVDIHELSLLTPDFTGSDLRELVRVATVHKIKKIIKQMKAQMSSSTSSTSLTSTAAETAEHDYSQHDVASTVQTPLTMEDFMVALRKTSRSETIARDYGMQARSEELSKNMDAFREYAKELF